MLPEPTRRLRFREMTEADLDEVTETLSATRADAERWIAWTTDNYRQHGFGLWVIETHDGRFVGDCGLTIQEVEGEDFVELGWHVHPDHRRLGYAAEAAASVLAAAGQARTADHLIAIIRPENVASQGVAQKIGLTLERSAFKLGGEALIFGTRLVPTGVS
ncbi:MULTISPECIES: GNAT family N-acetyltransferase [Nocardioides]|uniref:GNAT family N-acetyltransferase n=1 Tax=Nocardioides TaxID=1839 RepID=UPI00032DCFEC|nr:MULTISPECIES: GNAT family N-acetyltransferase [Nocardioides]EON23286.1 acetyltransferase [Nocardioides sp. CF8]